MESQINRLETRIEKMQEMFNKDLEEIKKSPSIMNNPITEIKSTLEGPYRSGQHNTMRCYFQFRKKEDAL